MQSISVDLLLICCFECWSVYEFDAGGLYPAAVTVTAAVAGAGGIAVVVVAAAAAAAADGENAEVGERSTAFAAPPEGIDRCGGGEAVPTVGEAADRMAGTGAGSGFGAETDTAVAAALAAAVAASGL